VGVAADGHPHTECRRFGNLGGLDAGGAKNKVGWTPFRLASSASGASGRAVLLPVTQTCSVAVLCNSWPSAVLPRPRWSAWARATIRRTPRFATWSEPLRWTSLMDRGRVAERLNAPVLKTGRRVTPVSGVRISPLPLATNDSTRGCAITRWRANERTSPRGACRAIRSQRSRSPGRRSIVAIRATASVAAKRKRVSSRNALARTGAVTPAMPRAGRVSR